VASAPRRCHSRRVSPKRATPRASRLVASDSFAEFLSEQLAPLGRVTMRRMFGKTGVFCNGLMLGMVTENTLYFRVEDHYRPEFREAESFPPLNYRKRGSTIPLQAHCPWSA
jgi:DNA transformation protein